MGSLQGVNGLSPYLDTGADKFALEEDSVLAYVALSVGPIGKEVSTTVTHLSAIGFFHRIRFGYNPIKDMSRVQLMLKGIRRASGHANRKLPFSAEDLRTLKGMLNLKDTDQLTLWAATLVGWFFMLRMSEFLVSDTKHAPTDRHPIYTNDLEPLCQGAPANWGDHVDEVCSYLRI